MDSVNLPVLPVFLRFGESGEELRIGELHGLCAARMQQAVPGFLRRLADEFEHHLHEPAAAPGSAAGAGWGEGEG